MEERHWWPGCIENHQEFLDKTSAEWGTIWRIECENNSFQVTILTQLMKENPEEYNIVSAFESFHMKNDYFLVFNLIIIKFKNIYF